MAPNPRVAKAFRAMRNLGIAEEKVKPVLKNLLKLYDKNWELIEEENYRVLADSIFEYEETEAAELKKKTQNAEQEEGLEEEAAQVHDEPERPLKRLRLRYQESPVSPSFSNSSPGLGGTSLKKPKLEVAETPEICPQQQSQDRTEPPNIEGESISAQPLIRNKGKQPVSVLERSEPSQPRVTKRIETGSISSPISLRDKGKEILSLPVAAMEKRPVSERSSHLVRLKDSMVEPGILLLPKKKVPDTNASIKPKDEPFTDDMPQFEIPIAVIHPESLSKEKFSIENGSVREPDGPEALASQPVDGDDKCDGVPVSSIAMRTDYELAKIPDESAANLEIASSPYGEVKISLSCNSALGRPEFHMPSLDEVLKSVEDKCLKTYKVLDPTFSVMKLMKDMCDTFLELGTDSPDKSLGTIDVTPAINLLKKSNIEVIPFCPLNGPVNIPQAAKAVLPQSPRLPSSFNGTNSCMEPGRTTTENGCELDKEKEQNCREDTNSGILVVVQGRHLSPDDIRSLHDVNDIAKGQESVVIPLVNEVNGVCLPSFHYIPQNAVFQNAFVNFSLARIGDDNCCSSCFGDCISSSTPCACSHEAGGDFAYTLEGLVKEDFLEECVSMNRDPQKDHLFYCKECPLERSKNEEILEPCKGHLMRKFIKECWWKCGCNKQCGNRVVQRGINCKLQVFMTADGKGWGLRTLEDLPKGAFVCEYVGEVLTNAELYERVSRSPSSEEHAYPVLLDADWGSEGVLKDEEALCLDATYYGNVARFVNHRCFDSNLVEIPVEVETPDHHYYHLAFFTTRKVEAFEELTWDYGIDFDDHDHPVKAFQCRCGSKFCRNIKRSSRSKSRATRR